MKISQFILGLVLLSGVAQASGYPPSYFHQRADVLHKGPMMYAAVSSGTMHADVIGYKQSGILARNNPDHIDAIVISECSVYDGSRARIVETVRLGREYHGKGYMSDGTRSFLGYSNAYYSLHCAERPNVQVAFSDGHNNWDSNYGANFPVSQEEFSDRNPNSRSLLTHEGSNTGAINLRAWDFIVNEMDR